MDMLHYKDDMEVLFVDNGSEDGTEEFIKPYLPMYNNNPMDVNGSWNMWVKWARGEYVWIINNDIRLTEHIDKKLIDQLEKVRPHWVYIMCPYSTVWPNEFELPFRIPEWNIMWWCFMMKAEDTAKCFPIPSELRLWYWDNWIYEKLDRKVGLGGWKIHHYESKSINAPETQEEINKIIRRDRLQWDILSEQFAWK